MLNSIHSIHMFQLAIVVVVVVVYSFIWTFFSYDGVINGVVFTVTVQYIPTYSNTWQSQMELEKNCSSAITIRTHTILSLLQ